MWRKREIMTMTEDKMLELWDKSGGDIYVYADLVAEHEREACANICEEKYYLAVADAIRARGEQE